MDSPPFQFADRLKNFQSNVFAVMDQAKKVASQKGNPIIDLSIGSTDLPTDERILKAIEDSIRNPETHGYLLFNKTYGFRQAIAEWYQKNFPIAVDPAQEVLVLIGSQEGTAHLPLTLLNPGEYALLQEPGYPSHRGGIHLADGRVHPMILREENNFLPDLGEVPDHILKKAKLMVLSYPHNPTAATATEEFFKEAVSFCKRHGLVLAHDFPYMDLTFSGSSAPSIFLADPEKSISIEFYSLSKSHNMSGFRVGFAIGNRNLINALKQIKSAIDFNQYQGILNGASVALSLPREQVLRNVQVYRERRDALVEALRELGWNVPVPQATMYLWTRLPARWKGTSREFCLQLAESTGVVLAPGTGFGNAGEGFVRFSLVRPPQELRDAASKIGSFLGLSSPSKG